jgi:hypothetical protein
MTFGKDTKSTSNESKDGRLGLQQTKKQIKHSTMQRVKLKNKRESYQTIHLRRDSSLEHTRNSRKQQTKSNLKMSK